MDSMILGMFADQKTAEKAVNNLQKEGYFPKEISLVMKETRETKEVAGDNTTTKNVGRSTVSGAVAGGVIGAIAGILVGVGAVAIPGIGPLLVAGPLSGILGLSGAAATTVTGAVEGVVAGGIFGALIGLGLPVETARQYEDRIKEGGVLVAVTVPEINDRKDPEEILKNYGADQIQVLTLNR